MADDFKALVAKVASGANLTRADGLEFMRLAEDISLKPVTRSFDLERANEAIEALRSGAIQGAAVLTMPPHR